MNLQHRLSLAAVRVAALRGLVAAGLIDGQAGHEAIDPEPEGCRYEV